MNTIANAIWPLLVVLGSVGTFWSLNRLFTRRRKDADDDWAEQRAWLADIKNT